MAFMAAAAPYLAAASTGMSILGGINQSNAQRAAGDAAYQNALMRAQMANVQANQLDHDAGQAEAASQRQAEDERRKGIIAVGRLRAVMGAAGAGFDDNLLASLQGRGDYNAASALYSGSEKARGMRNQAALDRWSGQAGVDMGAYDQSAANSGCSRGPIDQSMPQVTIHRRNSAAWSAVLKP
jgi:hypothetical protein